MCVWLGCAMTTPPKGGVSSNNLPGKTKNRATHRKTCRAKPQNPAMARQSGGQVTRGCRATCRATLGASGPLKMASRNLSRNLIGADPHPLGPPTGAKFTSRAPRLDPPNPCFHAAESPQGPPHTTGGPGCPCQGRGSGTQRAGTTTGRTRAHVDIHTARQKKGATMAPPPVVSHPTGTVWVSASPGWRCGPLPGCWWVTGQGNHRGAKSRARGAGRPGGRGTLKVWAHVLDPDCQALGKVCTGWI